MTTRGFVLALLVLAVSWSLVVPASRSQEQEDFVIVGADAVATRAAGMSLTLPIPLEARFIMERVDALSDALVEAVPELLPMALEPRYILERTDTLALREILPIPGDIPTLLEPRFIFERADTNRGIQMAYPRELIGDKTAPLLSISAPQVQADLATVSWQTDEFADSLLEYGLTPGSFPEAVYDPHYTTLHTFTLSGLLSDTTYYCRITSTDRSGNSASTTSGCQFTTTSASYIYLPLVTQ